MCTHDHSSTIYNSQKVCPSMNEQINKMHYIHTMEYYSALKRKEILTRYIMDEP